MASLWVFGPVADVVAFVLPQIVALALVPFVPSAIHQGDVTSGLLFYNLFVAMMIDHGHVYGTAVPVYFDRWRRQRLKWRALLVPAMVLSVGVLLARFSAQLFMTTLAYFAIWHICRQHFGWLVMLERKERSVGLMSFRKMDRLFFLATLLVPIYYWQADLSFVRRRYFNDFDMAIGLDSRGWEYILPVFQILSVLFFLSVVWRLWFEGFARFGKYLFLLLTWSWFFGGLVLSQNPIFFWVTLTICHGVSYHIHINRYWQSSFGGDPPRWFRSHKWRTIFGYLIVVTTLSIGLLATRGIWAGSGEGWRVAILNFFLVSHYVFDSFIWRKGFRADPALA